VSAFTVDRKIVHSDVCREVIGALREEVGDYLRDGLCEEGEGENGEAKPPAWVVARVLKFVHGLMPFVESSSVHGIDASTKGGVSGERSTAESETGKDRGERNGPGVVLFRVNEVLETSEQMSERFQDFYAALEQDLRTDGSLLCRRGHEVVGHHVWDLRGNVGGDGQEERDSEVETRVAERLAGEARIREVVESVERTVCELFYDRCVLVA
jgi:hypothetical protein